MGVLTKWTAVIKPSGKICAVGAFTIGCVQKGTASTSLSEISPPGLGGMNMHQWLASSTEATPPIPGAPVGVAAAAAAAAAFVVLGFLGLTTLIAGGLALATTMRARTAENVKMDRMLSGSLYLLRRGEGGGRG